MEAEGRLRGAGSSHGRRRPCSALGEAASRCRDRRALPEGSVRPDCCREWSRSMPAEEMTAVVNIGDDTVLHGLRISPDLDTVTYTLAGAVDTETGWGLREESGPRWRPSIATGGRPGSGWATATSPPTSTGPIAWTEGADLVTVIRPRSPRPGASWSLCCCPPRTIRCARWSRSSSDGSPGEIDFQDYFVRLRHSVPVTAASASPALPRPDRRRG